jgi:hypothetical protein
MIDIHSIAICHGQILIKHQQLIISPYRTLVLAQALESTEKQNGFATLVPSRIDLLASSFDGE